MRRGLSRWFGWPASRARGWAQPWWIISASLGGMLVAIAISGLLGLIINQNVRSITNRALTRDIGLEDLGDDLRVAILEVRHFHRDLIFYGPSTTGGTNFQNAMALLFAEIDNLERLDIADGRVVRPDDLRARATEYYMTFRPVLEGADPESPEAVAASTEGLEQLARLEDIAQDIDRLGEAQAEEALAGIERANASGRLALLGVLAGLGLVGAALAYAAVRVFGEVRRLYEAEQVATEGLAKALQAKSDFIADASHELRTPLTVLRGNAEAGLALDEHWAHREILEEIVSESARMTRLVEDLLVLARSDADTLPLDLRPIAISPFLDGLAERGDVLVRQGGATLTVNLAADGSVLIDARRIEQVVLILLDNAAKYSPPAGRVDLTSSTWRDELTIEVADRGPGVPKDALSHIFERFYRVDKARSRKLGGAGLGLAIAKTIVEAHGGRIEAQSRVGEGTKMRIHLPLTTGALTSQPVLEGVA